MAVRITIDMAAAVVVDTNAMITDHQRPIGEAEGEEVEVVKAVVIDTMAAAEVVDLIIIETVGMAVEPVVVAEAIAIGC